MQCNTKITEGENEKSPEIESIKPTSTYGQALSRLSEPQKYFHNNENIHLELLDTQHI